MKKRINVHLESNVLCGKYNFLVETRTHYFKGDDGGKQEDQPGWFMKQRIYLTKVSRKEIKLIQGMDRCLPFLLAQIPNHIGNEEVTFEPVGYEALRHEELVDKVTSQPTDYMSKRRLVDLLREND